MGVVPGVTMGGVPIEIFPGGLSLSLSQTDEFVEFLFII